MVIRHLLLGLLIYFAGIHANSASLDEGVNAYYSNRPSVAISIWMPLAKRGDPKAQNNVGLLYQRGEAVAKSRSRAIDWFRKAIAQGLPEAHHNLAVLLYEQNPLAVDDEIFTLFTYASKRNISASTYMLGLMHYQGNGVEKNFRIAAKLWETAAKKGNVEAQFMLAMLHQSGDLGPPRYDLAFIWSKIATDNGFETASEVNFFSTLKLSAESLPQLEETANRCRLSLYLECPE